MPSARRAIAARSSRVLSQTHSQRGGGGADALPSIKEMILSGNRLDYTFAMREYEIPRFDGKQTYKGSQRKDADWNKAKGNNFVDQYCKKKAFVPPPNNYKNVDAGYQVKVRAHALYKAPRQTDIAQSVKKAEKDSGVGPGTFHPKRPQDKVLGIYGGLERVTMAASEIMAATDVPASNKYDLPGFVSDTSSN